MENTISKAGKKYFEKFKFEPEIIEKIQQKKQKLEQDLYIVESDIDRMKRDIIMMKINALKIEL